MTFWIFALHGIFEILDRVTNKAIKKVEMESKNKSRNYIVEWFRYVELVGKDLNKYLN